MPTRIGRKARWGMSRVIKRLRLVAGRLVKPDAVDEALARIPDTIEQAELSGQVVVITGSTQGIGLALAKAFAEAKAKVVVNARTADDVERAVQSIRHAGGTAIGVCADVSTEAGVQQLIDTAAGAFGRVDILINNAAVLGPFQRRAWEVTPAEWQEVIAVNLTGAFLCARQVANWMVTHAVAGRIINISSGGARTPVSGMSPYIVSKAGLEALTRTMALDAGWDGLTVTGIELGSLQTRLTRLVFPWEEFQVLPPPEAAIPIVLYAATAPRERVHGRILAEWRFAKDPEAEVVLAGPLATVERFSFQPLRQGDRDVDRFDRRIVPLDRAENPQGMPGRVRALLNRLAQEANFARYPDEQYPSLRKALSARLKLPIECFTFGNGSVELVERAIRTFAQPGDEVISHDPSWFMFDRFCDILGVINRKVAFTRRDGGFDHNLDAVARAVGVNTRLIYLVSPSNPLGIGIVADQFWRFLQHIPSHIPVVVDEAYVEYSTRPETLRSHEVILHTDRRVIGLRTFSKFYGLAALRVGYAFAASETLRLFNRLEPLFVLSSVAEAAAVAALEDEEHTARMRETTDRERTRIQQRLAAAGIGYVPSEINFMLVECPGPPEKVYRMFAAEGIFVPKGVILDRYILFPIAQPAQNDKNLGILCSV